MIGTENQCLGVAESLGVTPRIMRINLREPWKTLTPWLKFEQEWSFSPPLSPVNGEGWPDLLICAGRKAIAAARYIKKQSKGKTFVTFLQDPKINDSALDLIAVPHHDTRRGENVIVTHGAPNRITPEKLKQAKKEFALLFEPMSAPRIAVLIGGNSRTHKITPNIIEGMITSLNTIEGSLMITASRRTGEENIATLKQGLAGENIYFWDGKGNNPYLGMLGWADHIIVTSDSVSMLSDAASTGKPVHIIGLEGGSKRFERLYKHFEEIGAMRPFKDGNLESWVYEPIHDAQLVADEIKRRLGLTAPAL
ncbi:MAG: mitochondrial fission ELM1 family protein [Alphaproteobacteria bacterium]|nr:mitochondrial fission ELM1 family protein [Alphaproteobacteria bacterium]